MLMGEPLLLYIIITGVFMVGLRIGLSKVLRTPHMNFGFWVDTKVLLSLLFMGFIVMTFLGAYDLQVYNYIGFGLAGALILGATLWIKLNHRQRRKIIDAIVRLLLGVSAAFAIVITLAILFSLITESLCFFQTVPFLDFITGTRWSPGVASSTSPGHFGVVPLLMGTVLITILAMSIAIPAGLMSAIYLSCYASDRFRSTVKPLLELLAGIPTVVYGFLALIAISPFLQAIGQFLHIPIAAESALGVGLVMGFMIIPYIASLSDDVIRAVPRTLHDASLALGATESETIKGVIIPAAFPGVMASFLLAVSRAIGETMIVVMAAGYSAHKTFNPLEAVTTVTVQIVSLLTGDQEFTSPKTLAAFALGLMLFLMTLVINMIAMRMIRYYREKYDT